MVKDDTVQNPEDRHFFDCMTTGDDFCKIEIYWQAVDWYRKAVELKPDNEEAREKLRECIAKKQSESKAIVYILVTAIVVVGILMVVLR